MSKNILSYFNKGSTLLDQDPHREMEKSGNGQSQVLCVCLKLMNQSRKVLNSNSQCYGVTLTLKKKYNLEDPIQVHRDLENYFKNRNWKSKNYIFVPEFTSNNGYLHYHGIIWDEYQCTVQKRLNSYRRKYGWCKPEYELRYRDCVNCKERVTKYPKCCWYHYMWKSRNVGLWTLYNFRA